MHGYSPKTYGEAFADVYDDWYGPKLSDVGTSDVEAMAAGLAELAGPARRALELGAGSGRVALPLAARGVDVWAVEASPAMIGRLRAKPGGERVRSIVADMAALPLRRGPRFSVVFAVDNTFFNLTSRPAQQACLRQVRELLVPAGRLVIEAFLPSVEPPGPVSAVEVSRIELDRVVLSVSRRDPGSRTVTGQHIEITEGGGVRLRPWMLCYATPLELDDLAYAAGLGLVARYADWQHGRVTEASTRHVSYYSPFG